MAYPDPVAILTKIDERIDRLEVELEDFVSSQPANYLTWSDKSIALVAEKRAALGYLRSQGKIEALVNFCRGIVDEFIRVNAKQKLSETEQRLTKVRQSLGRLKTANEKYWLAVNKGQEIVAKKPKYFSKKGSYLELAKRVCKVLEWPESRTRSVRRDLRDARVIPDDA